MKTHSLISLLILALGTAGNAAEVLDRLSPAEVTDAISRIRTSSLPGREIDGKELDRSTLQGLLGRLGPGAQLIALDGTAAAARVEGFRLEALPRSVDYCRLGDLTEENVTSLTASLTKKPAALAVILDLRTTQTESAYALAARVINLFAPAAPSYFQMQKNGTAGPNIFGGSQQPVYGGLLAVLINEDCGGPAETIAACLKQKSRGLLVGTSTLGKAMDYQRFPLGNLAAIEVAVNRIVLAEGNIDLTKGLPPDLKVAVSLDQERKILAASAQEGLGRYIFEVERPHVNEASLVSNTNPEIDQYRERQAQGNTPEVQPLLDRALQRALDALTTVLVSRVGAVP